MDVKKSKILIVEDEAVVRESLRDWLIENGYDVECVETGEEALERVENEGFGVIVLDLRLPGIDGLQVFEQAKKLKPETKGIMITAYPSRETQEKAQRLGLLDYLAKPFKVDMLEEIIRVNIWKTEGGVNAQVLKWFEVFKGLGDSELAQIAELCYARTLTEGDRVFEEGARATNVHLCRSGKVDIMAWVREPWNSNVMVHRVEPGELFGWSALVAPHVYTASAECVEAGKEICIKSSELLHLFDQNPHIGHVVMRNISAEVSERLTQTRQRLSNEWLESGMPSPADSTVWGEPKKR
jgi:CheY-like chemotaxis protein